MFSLLTSELIHPHMALSGHQWAAVELLNRRSPCGVGRLLRLGLVFKITTVKRAAISTAYKDKLDVQVAETVSIEVLLLDWIFWQK